MLKKIVFTLLILSLFLSPDIEGDFLFKVRKKIDSIKPFKVKFLNQVINDSVLEIEEKGVMTFRDKGKIKWEYLEPDHKIWILSDDSYEYYDIEDEQVTRGKLTKKTQLWIFQLLYTKELIENINIDTEGRQIHFLNEEEGADFRIYLSEKLLPSKIIQKDPTGVEIVYIFSEYKTNITLPSDYFQLKIKGEVDIIELK